MIRFYNEIPAPLYLSQQSDQIVNIVQEALHNAKRHASANRVFIQLLPCSACYEVAVEDDGCGFDVDAVSSQPGNHFGLSIMRARAQRIGGVLAINSRPGCGTRVVLRWPIAPDNAILRDISKTSETADSLFIDPVGTREMSL